MKIGFVCNEYPPHPHGGIGTFVQMLGRALVAAGHDVFVTGIYPATGMGDAYEVDEGVRVWRQKGPRFSWGGVATSYQLWSQVRQLCRDHGLDVVEVPDWQGLCAGWPALSAPVLVRLHGSVSYFAAETGRPCSRLDFHVEKWALRRADDWCSVSRYTADKTRDLFQLKREPATVIYNPVEMVDEAKTAPRDPCRVVFSGTLTAKKGIVSLIQAWPRVRLKMPNAELHVFGKDGKTDEGLSMRSHLESLLGDSQSQGVTFHGHISRSELFENLARARVAVFPSYAEAFAIAPLEAMATGCPVVVTSRGSGPELIADEENGLLVDPDSHASIATALLRVLTDDELAKRLGENGRRHVQQELSLSTLCRANVAFYEQCAERFQAKNRLLCESR